MALHMKFGIACHTWCYMIYMILHVIYGITYHIRNSYSYSALQVICDITFNIRYYILLMTSYTTNCITCYIWSYILYMAIHVISGIPQGLILDRPLLMLQISDICIVSIVLNFILCSEEVISLVHIKPQNYSIHKTKKIDNFHKITLLYLIIIQ